MPVGTTVCSLLFDSCARYARIIRLLESEHSAKVLTAFVGDPSITEQGSEVKGGTDADIHDRDVEWLEEADGGWKERHDPIPFCTCFYASVSILYFIKCY